MPVQAKLKKIKVTLTSKVKSIDIGEREDYKFYLRREKKNLKRFFEDVARDGIVHLA